MWTSVYITKKEDNISHIRQLLRDGGIITSVKCCEEYYEILVPSCELAAAQGIIIETSI